MPALPVSLYSRALLRVRRSSARGKICKVVLVSGRRRAVNAGLAVVCFGLFMLAQLVIAYAELDAGEVSIAILGNEGAARFVLRDLQRQLIPKNSGLIFF